METNYKLDGWTAESEAYIGSCRSSAPVGKFTHRYKMTQFFAPPGHNTFTLNRQLCITHVSG